MAKAWAEHRARIEVERGDLRTQIRTYSEATRQLWDETQRQYRVLITAYQSLAVLDSERVDYWKAAIPESEQFIDRFARFKAQSERDVPVILEAKDLKFLRGKQLLSRICIKQLTRRRSGAMSLAKL